MAAPTTAYCTNCMAQRKVNRKPSNFLAVVLMTCQGCGHWIKCPRCMAIRSETHECAQ